MPIISSIINSSNVISSSKISQNMSTYTLTFKYVEIEDNKLIEVNQTEDYTFNYIFEQNYSITQKDYEMIYSDVNKEIPNNQGGYYVFDGFYSDLDMNKDNIFSIGFIVDNNYTFYYTMIGGTATPPTPTGTFKLNIEDPNNYIYDKPNKENSYFYPGEIITLHSYPIMDADLAMYIDGEFYSIQTTILIDDNYIWEYTFEMKIQETTISFIVQGGI